MSLQTPSAVNLTLTYALLVGIWATTPLAIVWSVSDIYPLWALALRFFLALPFALLLLKLFKVKLPLNKLAFMSYLAGACSFVGSQFFTYLSTDYLSSGMIALMFGLAPIITGLIGRFVFGIRLATLQWLGMSVALMGLAVICFAGSTTHIHPIGIALALLGVLIYCATLFWIKHLNAQVEPMAQATGSIIVSVIFCCVMLPFIWTHVPTGIPSARALGGLFYAVIMASLIAMFCYFKLVQHIQASTLSLTTVLTPVIALMVGVVLNDEMLSWKAWLGVVILLFGLVLYFYKDFKASRVLASKEVLKKVN
jgi:drug/metabolite transporter (DMT)-like permease